MKEYVPPEVLAFLKHFCVWICLILSFLQFWVFCENHERNDAAGSGEQQLVVIFWVFCENHERNDAAGSEEQQLVVSE